MIRYAYNVQYRPPAPFVLLAIVIREAGRKFATCPH